MLKHKKCLPPILIPLILGTLLYAGGYVSQLLNNYAVWTAAGGTPGNGTAPRFPDCSAAACFHALSLFPYSLYSILLCFGTSAFLVVFVMRLGSGKKGEYDRERNLTYSGEGTYGTSGFMSESELRKVLELVPDVGRSGGTILGQLWGKAVCLPEHTRLNRNVAVFGASGSMKSRAYARNMVFQCARNGHSLIITDPKSELYDDLSLYLKGKGYAVKVFNLKNPENSDSWNCLAEIGSDPAGQADGREIMAQLFCDVIIRNTGSLKGDRFWDNSEMNLLKALVLYVEQSYPLDGKNMEQVYRLLTMCTEKELDGLFSLLPVSHPAKAPYNIFMQASDTVRSGVIIGLGTRLQVFQNRLIRQVTKYDEIDLTRPGYEKCAYFCITSDQDSTFDFLSSLFMSFVFIKLVRYADKYGEGGQLPVPVHILADELANGGCTIADLTKKISTIRSRSLSISCIFQNLPQMSNRYPDSQYLEIIGNCDVQLFLGCTDEMTAEFISARTGETSVTLSSEAKQLNSWQVSDYTPGYRKTLSVGKRRLMTPDEILRLPLDNALVIIRGQKVLKVQKYDYTLHPESKNMIPCRSTNHRPEWRRQTEEDRPTGRKQEAARSVSKKQRGQAETVPASTLTSPNYAFTVTDKQSIMS